MTDYQSQLSNVDTRLSSNDSKVGGTHESKRLEQAASSETETTTKPLVTNPSQECDMEVQKMPLSDNKAGVSAGERNRGLVRSLSQTLPKKRRPQSFGSSQNSSFTIHDEGSQASQQSASTSTVKYAGQGPCSEDSAKSSQSLQRTSSLVRLSMSLDGKAQVTTSTGTTPSPPRSQPVPFSDPVRRPHTGLRRSFSAIGSSEKETPSSITNRGFRRPATGRSRDARTWEFYCDKDARDALTEQAEREESGSATAVIALIKSNSSTSKAVTTKSNKRNAHNQKLEAVKRLKANGLIKQKPKPNRSQSSLANMQTVGGSVDSKAEEARKAHRKPSSQINVFELYEGDSDKENWVPGTQQRSPPRRRPAGSSQSRRILEESLRHSASLGALMSQERGMSRRLSSLKASDSSTNSSTCEEKENGVPKVDDEVAASIDGTAPPREADDLDCVQNLLSLSQAVWQ